MDESVASSHVQVSFEFLCVGPEALHQLLVVISYDLVEYGQSRIAFCRRLSPVFNQEIEGVKVIEEASVMSCRPSLMIG